MLRNKFIALLGALALVGLLISPAQADQHKPSPHGVVVHSDSAYTHVVYIFKDEPVGGYRLIWVKCHTSNSWQAMAPGQSSAVPCGGNGWIERTWSDADIYVHVRNTTTGNVTIYPPGNNGIGGGFYNMWGPTRASVKTVAKVWLSRAINAFKHGAKRYTYTP